MSKVDEILDSAKYLDGVGMPQTATWLREFAAVLTQEGAEPDTREVIAWRWRTHEHCHPWRAGKPTDEQRVSGSYKEWIEYAYAKPEECLPCKDGVCAVHSTSVAAPAEPRAAEGAGKETEETVKADCYDSIAQILEKRGLMSCDNVVESVEVLADTAAAAVTAGGDAGWIMDEFDSILETIACNDPGLSMRAHKLREPLRKALSPAAQAQDAGEPKVEYRLFDSQWVNVIHHDNLYAGYSVEDAVNKAVKLTEQFMRANIEEGKFPSARALAAEGAK